MESIDLMQRVSERRLVPAGPRRRASRRKSFMLPTRDSELSQRRRQSERLQRTTIRGTAPLTLWRWLLGIAACCEFIIFLLPKVSLENTEEHNEATEQSWWSVWNWFQAQEEEPMTMENAVVPFETPALTFLYSLYFIDACVQAHCMRDKTYCANEKERLLHGEEHRRRVCWNPSVVFVITLLFYLIMLPTWFWWEVVSFLGIPVEALTSSNVVNVSAIERPYYSLGYAIIVHFYQNLSSSIKTTLEEQGAILERTIKRRLYRFFIFNPRTFIRRYRKVQLAIVWIKYLAPIGAHVMNSDFVFVGIELLKTWRQEATERYQQLRRRSLWIRLDDQARRELAAVIIQRNYRSYRSRKWVRLVRQQVEKREEEIIMLVQRAIKKRSRQELEEQEEALNELELLQEHTEVNRNAKPNEPWSSEGVFHPFIVEPTQQVNEEDLKRQYELQQEIQRKLQREKQRLMLISPDSQFIFRFQLLYLVCALIETAHLVLQPMLEEDENDESKGETTWTMNALRLFFRHAHGIVNLILGCGIIIKFFVGDHDPVTGRLVPRSFFSRWIYPGLLLHLVVNPALSEISSAVNAFIAFLFRAGPGRVWRWWILFLFPIWKRVLVWLEWKIWIRLVQRENQNLTTNARPAL